MQTMTGYRLEIPPVDLAKRGNLIVFDLDGTVVDSKTLHRLNYRRVFEQMGYGTLTDEEADRLNGPNGEEICRIMGVAPKLRAWYNTLYDESVRELVLRCGRMFPGMVRVLQRLSQTATLALLSNGSQAYCEANVQHFALNAWFARYTGYVDGMNKADNIRKWMLAYGQPRLMVVGDRAGDIRCAREAGAIAIGVTYGMGEREELKDADALCDTPEEILSVCEAYGMGRSH